MATYAELRSLFNSDALRNRVTTAVVIAAQAELVANPGTANGRSWALKVLASPEAWGSTAYKAVLAQNKSVTAANIETATDAAIQTNVDALTAALIAAEAGA